MQCIISFHSTGGASCALRKSFDASKNYTTLFWHNDIANVWQMRKDKFKTAYGNIRRGRTLPLNNIADARNLTFRSAKSPSAVVIILSRRTFPAKSSSSHKEPPKCNVHSRVTYWIRVSYYVNMYKSTLLTTRNLLLIILLYLFQRKVVSLYECLQLDHLFPNQAAICGKCKIIRRKHIWFA